MAGPLRPRNPFSTGAGRGWVNEKQLLGHEKLETTAIHTEVAIRQSTEVHARCHPSAHLPAAAAPA